MVSMLDRQSRNVRYNIENFMLHVHVTETCGRKCDGMSYVYTRLHKKIKTKETQCKIHINDKELR